jgi:hypothetical protein
MRQIVFVLAQTVVYLPAYAPISAMVVTFVLVPASKTFDFTIFRPLRIRTTGTIRSISTTCSITFSTTLLRTGAFLPAWLPVWIIYNQNYNAKWGVFWCNSPRQVIFLNWV